jgi:hypothetical protein
MGKSIYYIRKRPKQRCINPDHFQFYYIDSYCKCTLEDYECDMGFMRAAEGTCIPRNGEEVDLSPPKTCDSNYIVRMGYKKSADNSCVGGETHEDKELACPGGSGFLSAIFSFVWNVRISLYIFFNFIGLVLWNNRWGFSVWGLFLYREIQRLWGFWDFHCRPAAAGRGVVFLKR